jgi:hypothetical protein
MKDAGIGKTLHSTQSLQYEELCHRKWIRAWSIKGEALEIMNRDSPLSILQSGVLNIKALTITISSLTLIRLSRLSTLNSEHLLMTLSKACLVRLLYLQQTHRMDLNCRSLEKERKCKESQLNKFKKDKKLIQRFHLNLTKKQ